MKCVNSNNLLYQAHSKWKCMSKKLVPCHHHYASCALIPDTIMGLKVLNLHSCFFITQVLLYLKVLPTCLRVLIFTKKTFSPSYGNSIIYLKISTLFIWKFRDDLNAMHKTMFSTFNLLWIIDYTKNCFVFFLLLFIQRVYHPSSGQCLSVRQKGFTKYAALAICQDSAEAQKWEFRW